MIFKLFFLLAAVAALLGSIYVKVHQHGHGVLDTVKPQQVPRMKSAKTIRDYRQ